MVDFSSMVSFKEITDLAVLSYGMNFINDAEFLLLYNSYSSENLYLPYHLYPEFDLQNFNEMSDRISFQESSHPKACTGFTNL